MPQKTILVCSKLTQKIFRFYKLRFSVKVFFAYYLCSKCMDGQSQYLDADGQFSNAPYFNWNDGELRCNANRRDNANANYGSASGFLPKSSLKIRTPELNRVFLFFLILFSFSFS